jgi:Gdp/GTP exchange factor required for growth at low temperatures
MWETRISKDLKEWVSSKDCFKHIRTAVDGIVDAKTFEASTYNPSTSNGHAESQANRKGAPEALSTTCIPFIGKFVFIEQQRTPELIKLPGIYLSEIHHHNQLPDLIDPTAPNEVVNVDPDTPNFDVLSHPEVFSSLAPLPPSVALEPLINVHKQRLIAGVAQSLVHGQHAAKRVQFPLEKKLYQRCTRLQAFDNITLCQILGLPG